MDGVNFRQTGNTYTNKVTTATLITGLTNVTAMSASYVDSIAVTSAYGAIGGTAP